MTDYDDELTALLGDDLPEPAGLGDDRPCPAAQPQARDLGDDRPAGAQPPPRRRRLSREQQRILEEQGAPRAAPKTKAEQAAHARQFVKKRPARQRAGSPHAPHGPRPRSQPVDSKELHKVPTFIEEMFDDVTKSAAKGDDFSPLLPLFGRLREETLKAKRPDHRDPRMKLFCTPSDDQGLPEASSS